MTTVIVKLENIGDGVTEIKSDLKNIKDDIKEFREWKATATQQIKVLEKNVFKGSIRAIRKEGDDEGLQ